jgi:predicted nucleotide-binding protein
MIGSEHHARGLLDEGHMKAKLTKSMALAESEIRERIDAAQRLLKILPASREEHISLRNEAQKWRDVTLEFLRHLFDDSGSIAFDFTGAGGPYVVAADAKQEFNNIQSHLNGEIRYLETLIARLKYFPESSPPPEPAAPAPAAFDLTRVFLVHGRDDGTKETVARFLEGLGLKVDILHEHANKGRSLITKFREVSEGCSFAVVLMTPDDKGGIKDSEILKPRARQNVVFEMAYFIGKLGFERVAALVKGEIERPSDLDGVVYIDMEKGDWKLDLMKELKAAGYSVNLP